LPWSKNGIQRNGILKKFAPFKLLAYFKRFENLVPISKYFVKRCFKPFVCVFENFEKSGLLQMAFSKNGFMKTWFQGLLKMLYLKRFWFTKSKTNFKKGNCFQMKTISSCFPILQE
jgi:hypothetical protein